MASRQLAVGEQAIVADAVEAWGQDVEEEAADELGSGEGHRFVPGAPVGAVILPAEGDAFVAAGDQPAVGNGDTMGVAGEVGQHRRGAGERPLGIDEPLGLLQRRKEGGKGPAIGERCLRGEEGEPVLRVRGGEPF